MANHKSTATSKPSFILYKDFREVLLDMTVEQAGIIFKAIYEYQHDKTVCDVPCDLTFVLKTLIAQFNRDNRKYDAICVKRSDAGKKSAEQKLANASKRKHKPTSATERDSDSDSVIDREIDNNTTTGATKVDATEFYLTAKGKKLTGKRLYAFDRLWKAFNYKKDKAKAADSFVAIPELTDALVDLMCSKAKSESARRDSLIANGRTPIYLQGWITAKRWEDEDIKEVATTKTPTIDVAKLMKDYV